MQTFGSAQLDHFQSWGILKTRKNILENPQKTMTKKGRHGSAGLDAYDQEFAFQLHENAKNGLL